LGVVSRSNLGMQLKFINAFGRGPNTPSKRSFHDSNAKNSSGPQAAREPPPNTPLRWQRRGAQERTCLRGRQLTIRHREVSPSVKYRAAWSTSFFDLATAQGRALSSLLTSEAQRLVFPTMRRHAQLRIRNQSFTANASLSASSLETGQQCAGIAESIPPCHVRRGLPRSDPAMTGYDLSFFLF